jgi:hypothetical protein
MGGAAVPLRFTGTETNHPDGGVAFRAESGPGAFVVVRISDEAIQDFGLSRAMTVASDKFDRGELEPNGIVSVRTSDFGA